MQMTVIVRAESILDLGDGRFEVSVPAREPSEQERRVLRDLFPHLGELAYELLAKEALLQAVESEPRPETGPQVQEHWTKGKK